MLLEYEKMRKTEKLSMQGVFASMKLVEEFHQQMQVSEKQNLSDSFLCYAGDSQQALAETAMKDAGERIKQVSVFAMDQFLAHKDMRWLRVHLIAEEFAEVIEGLADGDHEQALDGLGDLLYVLLGTAVTFELPLHAAFVEIDMSNKTKEKQPDDVCKDRVRQKGPNYVPPDLKSIMQRADKLNNINVFDDLRLV